MMSTVNTRILECMRWSRSRDSRRRKKRKAGRNTKAEECVNKRSEVRQRELRNRPWGWVISGWRQAPVVCIVERTDTGQRIVRGEWQRRRLLLNQQRQHQGVRRVWQRRVVEEKIELRIAAQVGRQVQSYTDERSESVSGECLI